MPLTQVQPGMLGTPQPYNFKNRIINGAMVIDQRNAGASVTPANNAVTFSVDRWGFFVNQASKLTFQQNSGSVTPPAGFTNYLGVVSSSAYSVGSTDRFLMYQAIEGFNTADLGWGTANAATVTLSFWVRSSLTGTFGGSLQNNGSSRSYVFSYSIPVANTWTQISITIAGETTGTWLTNNGAGIQVVFSYGDGSTYLNTAGSWYAGLFDGATGQTNLVGTNGATWYVTGVQLEQGVTATSFDFRSIGQELALAQRYYAKINSTSNSYGMIASAACARTSTLIDFTVNFPVPMRAAPSSLESASICFRLFNGSAIALSSVGIDGATATPYGTLLNGVPASSQTSGNFGTVIQNNNTSGFIAFSAEL
jgi:hypothetical protein